MRILHITPFLGEQHGGSERYAHKISKHLVQRGHNIDIYTSCINPKTPRQSIIDGINVHRFCTPKVIWNINPLCLMLPALLKSNHDIIHAHSHLYFTSNQALLAKCLRSLIRRPTRIILHLHGGVGNPRLVPHSPLRKVVKRLYDAHIGFWMIKNADCVISTDRFNAQAAAQLFQIPIEKIPIIHNGIDLTTFSPNHNNNNSKEILYVGDLEPWKGVNSLIQAMNLLHELNTDFTLKVVGDGSLRHSLEAQTTNSNTEFIGQVPHSKIPQLMNNAYAVVLPSLWEGIPTVGLEAMASGTPFIGSNIGGIPEIVTHETTGLLIPPNNPREIVNALLRLTNPQLRKKLVHNARNLVTKKHAIPKICEKLEHLYTSITNQ